ncbi:MAG: hypothetical protein HOI15_00285, partial [Opitutales bacterium]|nr:hypothetical protein [Opitutales bacterium]
MIPVFSSSPTSPNAVSSYTVRSQCLIGRRRELGETGMGPKGNVQSVIVLSFLAVVSISLLSRAAAQSSNSSWQPQSSVIEMWSEKRSEHNFDESRVPEYELPNPLVLEGGQDIRNQEEWMEKGRPALLQLFREYVYGVRPTTEYQIEYEEIGRRENAFGVGATGRQIRATIHARGRSHSFDFVIVVPRSKAPVPVIVQINNRYLIPLDKAVDEFDPFWPVEKLLRRGYATASFHTSHVDPDKRDGYEAGIRSLLDDPDSDPETRWGGLSAWGWAASRVLDFAIQQPEIDPERSVVVGHSRGGKAALWAGAEDERFGIAYSNNSGCGGAALSRRGFGETVARINRNFPHWFCDRFNAYNDRESELPIDQHELIALAAPRAVYVTSSDEDLWADPRGEYSSLVGAGPVFDLFGLEHITEPVMPELNTPRHVGSTGYHIRTGVHNLTEQDWGYFLDF